MSDLQEDLDATVESVVQDAERLIAVEREKQAAAARSAATGWATGEAAVERDRAQGPVEDEIADQLAERAD